MALKLKFMVYQIVSGRAVSDFMVWRSGQVLHPEMADMCESLCERVECLRWLVRLLWLSDRGEV